MSMTRYAEFQVLTSWVATRDEVRPVQALSRSHTAKRWNPTYTVKQGYLYVRSRAISSRINDNHDGFPAEEIAKSYRSFVGKPVFVNHHNENHRRARGVVIDAELHEDTNPDGTPDTWAEVLMEIDALKFPRLAQAVLAGHCDRTSMGCNVAHSVCTACGNKASNPSEFCKHIPASKGMRITRTTASGTKESVIVAEMCYGLDFFENSILVEQPADPTAYMWGVDNSGLTTTAGLTSTARAALEAPGEGWCMGVTARPGSTYTTSCHCNTYAAGGKDFDGWQVCAVPDCGHTLAIHRGGTEVVSSVQRFAALVQASSEDSSPAAIKARAEVNNAVRDGRMKKPGSCSKCKKSPGSENIHGHHHKGYSNPMSVQWLCSDCHGKAHEKKSSRTAREQTVAPPTVDTLRNEGCPVCGQSSFTGTKCLTCGFQQPPSMFQDPDLTKARELDRTQDAAGGTVATPPPDQQGTVATPPGGAPAASGAVATPPAEHIQGRVATPPSDFGKKKKAPPSKDDSSKAPASKTDKPDDGKKKKNLPPWMQKKTTRIAQNATQSTGAMVALYPDTKTAESLALSSAKAEGADDLHVTLAFLGESAEMSDAQVNALHDAVSQAAAQTGPLAGEVAGTGCFKHTDDGKPYIALIDLPGLPAWREMLVSRLLAVGVPVVSNHGYTPHMTLAYLSETGEMPTSDIAGSPITFGSVTVVVGDARHDYPLSQSIVIAGAETYDPGPGPHTVLCDHCGKEHEATYSHEGQWGQGPIYAVVCPEDWLTDYYNTYALRQK